MKSKMLVLLLVTVILSWTRFTSIPVYGAGDTPMMTDEELKGRLGDPEVVIVDVRTSDSWKGSDSKIKGAVREDPAGVQDFVRKYAKDKTLVFYCS